MFQVYGIKNIQYYHVYSPRFRDEPRWGDTFPDRDACQRTCDALKVKHGVKFLHIYPREVEQPMENDFDKPDES